MRTDHPGADELRRNFEEGLAAALAGRIQRSGTGLDLRTAQALRAVARAHPRVPDELVTAARTAFAGQLDGTNAAAERETHRRRIAEVRARRSATRGREG